METSTILLNLVFIYLRPTLWNMTQNQKSAQYLETHQNFGAQHLGDHWVFLEYLLLGHQYIYIWVQVLRNFPWVGAIGVIGVYWSLGVPNGIWVSYWARNGASTFQNSIEDNASLMHIGLFVCWLIFFNNLFFLLV